MAVLVMILIIVIIIVTFMVSAGSSMYGKDPLKVGDISEEVLDNYGIDVEECSIRVNYIDRVGVDVQKKLFFKCSLEVVNIEGVKRKYFKFSDKIDLNKVIDVELIENNNIVNKISSGSMLTRAVVGGALAGGAGAIIGGTTAKGKSSNMLNRISLRFKIDDIQNPYKLFLLMEDNRKEGLSQERQQEAWNLFGKIELILRDMEYRG